MKMFWIGLLLLVSVVLLGACSFDVERNEDGSLQITAQISEQDIADAVANAIDDPNVNSVTVDPQNGSLFVTVERMDASGNAMNSLTFNAILSVVDGRLGAEISNVQGAVVGEVDPARVDRWNQNLANRLEIAGNRSVNSTLERVEVTEDGITMEWRRETRQSRESES